MDISEIRRQNLLLLIDKFKTQAEFADKIDKPASYISQLKKGKDKKGKETNMGSDFARDIENKLGLERGWLDNYQIIANQVNSGNFHNTQVSQNVNSPFINYKAVQQDLIDIRFYENANINNTGVYQVSKNLIQQMGNANRLFAVPVLGRDMQPLLMDKAMVVADESKADYGIVDGQIYALQIGESIRCRYLGIVWGGRVRVYSEQNEEGEILDQTEFDKHFKILGGVIWQSSFFNW